MTSPTSRPTARAPRSTRDRRPPSRRVTAVAVLTALICVGFAALNIAFEITDRFSGGPHAEYAAGISVVNWFVVALKAAGAAVALLSVADRPRGLSPTAVALALWAAFATLGVYALGSVVQALGMASGLMGDAAEIDLLGVAYVLFFLAFATGFGVLALSHTLRHRIRARVAVLGALGGPVVLAAVLAGVPALLTAVGAMPAQ